MGLGGNQGNVIENFAFALRSVEKRFNSCVASRIYRTSPVSAIEQPHFLNACCRFECFLSPFELLSALGEIEKEAGKVPKRRDEPRPLDLDLLFYGEEVLFSQGLVLPHPRWHERLFVIAPLADLGKLPFGLDASLFLEHFVNRNNESVELYEESFCR